MSRKIEIYPGDKFGHLTIIKEVDKNKYGLRQMLCKCDCGNEKVITVSHLTGGASISCGCGKYTNPRTNISELIGQRYGRLTVQEFIGKPLKNIADNRNSVKCICDCGKETIVTIKNLKSGITTSCGCAKIDACARRKTHGLTSNDNKGTSLQRLYHIYHDMLARCNNPNCSEYKNYGKRGIKICPEWMDNINHFINWALKNGYDNTLTIDRIDVNGGYCPENCRWATSVEQCNNTRQNRLLIHNGEIHTVAEWSKLTGIKMTTLLGRISRGYPEEIVFKKGHITYDEQKLKGKDISFKRSG